MRDDSDTGKAPQSRPPSVPVYEGLFARDGVMMRTPDGNAETKAREAVERGFEWVAGNVGDGHSWDDWDPEGGTFVPWCRVYSTDDVRYLLDQAVDAKAPAVLVNLEVEAQHELTPAVVRRVIGEEKYLGEIGVSMEGWLYNSVDWRPLGCYPFLLQAFDKYRTKIPDLIAHAHEKGVTTAFPTLQAYGVADGKPDRHGWKGPISIFTGDDVRVWPT